MIDNFALGLTHALMLYVAWRLMSRADLDAEAPPKREARRPAWRKQSSIDA